MEKTQLPKGLLVGVYRDYIPGESEQITNIFDDFILVTSEPQPSGFEPIPEVMGTDNHHRILVLKHMVIGENLWFYAVPYNQLEFGMFGGNFIHTCDSRFSKSTPGYPIPVHDRFEK